MVKRFVRKSWEVLNSSQTSIFSAALFIILTTVLSQILGILKYRLLVSFFGASNEAGVFLAAFRLPDFLFQTIIAGSISSVFIPILSEYISKDKKSEAFHFTSSFITIGAFVFLLIAFLIVIFSRPLSFLIAPGFSIKENILMANLTRIIVFSQLFFLLGTLITAILQSFHYFLVPGIASSLYNLGIIIGIFFLSPVFGIYGAVLGVILGAGLFFFAQVPLLVRVGFKFIPTFNIRNGVDRIAKLLVPRFLTLFVNQLGGLVNVFFASFVSARGFLIFDLAQTLIMAAAVLLGQSIAQASFPTLSLKSNDKNEFTSVFLSSFSQILYLTMPISALLIVLRIPIVRLFFGASRFDWQATVDTGRTLAFFAVSLFASSLIYLLARAFFALKDTKTPFFVTLFSTVINILFSYLFILIYKLPVYYLAFAYSIATLIAVVLLIFLLDFKIGGLPKLSLYLESLKIFLATFVMGVALYVPIKLLDQLVFDTTKTINLIALASLSSAIGFLTYIFFTWLLDIKEAYYAVEVFKHFGNWKKMLGQIRELIE